MNAVWRPLVAFPDPGDPVTSRRYVYRPAERDLALAAERRVSVLQAVAARRCGLPAYPAELIHVTEKLLRLKSRSRYHSLWARRAELLAGMEAAS